MSSDFPDVTECPDVLCIRCGKEPTFIWHGKASKICMVCLGRAIEELLKEVPDDYCKINDDGSLSTRFVIALDITVPSVAEVEAVRVRCLGFMGDLEVRLKECNAELRQELPDESSVATMVVSDCLCDGGCRCGCNDRP